MAVRGGGRGPVLAADRGVEHGRDDGEPVGGGRPGANIFPLMFTLSFNKAWVLVLIILLIIVIFVVWQYERVDASPSTNEVQPLPQTTATPTEVPKQTVQHSTNTAPILTSKNSFSNMTKEQVLALIDEDIIAAFEALDTIFLGKNATYKDLAKEYFEQPNSFALAPFRSKLKRFVIINWK